MACPPQGGGRSAWVASAEEREGVGRESRREKERLRAHERGRASIPVGSGGVCMHVCVLPFVETFYGSTNDYTAAKPSQWRRRRRCKVRWICYLILPLTLTVAALFMFGIKCYCYFYAILCYMHLGESLSLSCLAVIFIVSLCFLITISEGAAVAAELQQCCCDVLLCLTVAVGC